MATVLENLSVDEPGAASRPELLVAAVLHLMSHYTARPPEAGACLKLASVIERHFQVLAELPELAPVLRATCAQLHEQWATIVEQAMPRAPKPGLFTRIIGSDPGRAAAG